MRHHRSENLFYTHTAALHLRDVSCSGNTDG